MPHALDITGAGGVSLTSPIKTLRKSKPISNSAIWPNLVCSPSGEPLALATGLDRQPNLAFLFIGTIKPRVGRDSNKGAVTCK